MDITAVFGTVIGGSSPSEGIRLKKRCFFKTYAGRSHILQLQKWRGGVASAFTDEERRLVTIRYLYYLKKSAIIDLFNCGHSLVVERVLAKDEMGVRFSLAAPAAFQGE